MKIVQEYTHKISTSKKATSIATSTKQKSPLWTLFYPTSNKFSIGPIIVIVTIISIKPINSSDVVCPVFFLNLAKKLILFRCHPWMVSPGALPSPSDATVSGGVPSASLDIRCLEVKQRRKSTAAKYKTSD